MRIYRAIQQRELEGIEGQPINIIDTQIERFLDLAYSHEMSSHTHANERKSIFFSWTSDYRIAKQFLEKKKGTGGYIGIAYADIQINEQGIIFPNEIMFAYPLFRRENWIDLLIIREYYKKNSENEKENDYIEIENMNYKTKKKPRFLSNLLLVRNNAFSMACRTKEYILIYGKQYNYNLIDDIEQYKDQNVSELEELKYTTGITEKLIQKANTDKYMLETIKSVMSKLKKEVEEYYNKNIMSDVDYYEIMKTLEKYQETVMGS